MMNVISILSLLTIVSRIDSIGMRRDLPSYGIGMGDRGFGITFKQLFFPQDMFSPKTNRCEDPCKNIEATCKTYGSQCRIVSENCFIPPCYSVPKCVRNPIEVNSLNPCQYNKPVLMTNNQEYSSCFYPGTRCPTGSRCVGYTEGSKCCYAPAGCKAVSAVAKTSIPAITSSRFCPSPNEFACRRQNCQRHQDCPFGLYCCSTSCGTRSCYLPMGHDRPGVNIAAMFRDVRVGIPVNPIVSLRDRHGFRRPYSLQEPQSRGLSLRGLDDIDRGTCPSVMMIKTCHPDMCASDADCYLGKCCISRCGKRVCTAGKGRISFFG